jgi:hypothetical protein
MAERPTEKHITYHLEYRQCADPSCDTCRTQSDHDPSWYAYWRNGPQVYSLFIGTVRPTSLAPPTTHLAPESMTETLAHGAVNKLHLETGASRE